MPCEHSDAAMSCLCFLSCKWPCRLHRQRHQGGRMCCDRVLSFQLQNLFKATDKNSSWTFLWSSILRLASVLGCKSSSHSMLFSPFPLLAFRACYLHCGIHRSISICQKARLLACKAAVSLGRCYCRPTARIMDLMALYSGPGEQCWHHRNSVWEFSQT